MTRLLLLDDSVTIQKVVRLTFANEESLVVDVAKNEAEARVALQTGPAPDVVVGYARFVQDRTPQFFEEVRARCRNVLVITESTENTQAFEELGFHSFLKKPFPSDELRRRVAEFETGPVGPDAIALPALDAFVADAAEFSEAHDEPTHAVKVGTRSQGMGVGAGDRAPPPVPPPPPVTLRSMTRAPERSPAVARPYAAGSAAARLDPAQGVAARARISDEAGPSPFDDAEPGVPRITMDVDSLERSYRATLTQRTHPLGREETVITGRTEEARAKPPPPPPVPLPEARPASGAFSFDAGEDDTLSFSRGPESALDDRGGSFFDTVSPFASVSAAETPAAPTIPPVPPAPVRLLSRTSGPAIDLPPPPSEPLVLEDVVVNRPPPAPHKGTPPVGGAGRAGSFDTPPAPFAAPVQRGIDRAEIEAAIDDALMRALERAVPAKIETKLEAEWSRLAFEVATKMRPEVATALKSDVSLALRGWVETEIRREVKAFLGDSLVTLAKEIVREEIRRLVEE